MPVLLRAITYAVIFISLVLIFLPAKVLSWSSATPLDTMGWMQIAGIAIGSAGGVLALSCVAAFIRIGKGTPAPFDPPRHLVTRGPYRFVRNPMYLGAALALGGAAMVYESLALLLFVMGFLVMTHTFVVLYEEPTLRRLFGSDYEDYCHCVHRWMPGAYAGRPRRVQPISIRSAVARKH